MKFPHRLFELLLLLFPRPFRDRFGTSMRETFDDRYEASRREGARAVVGFALRTAGNLTHEGIRERLRPTLGGATAQGQRHSRMGWGVKIGNLAQDLRFALRSLGRRPGFTVVAVGTLTLGIGANTAIFSVVNGVLLRSLPYPDPSGLVTVDEAPNDPAAPPGVLSGPDIFDIESEAPSLTTLVGVNAPSMTLTGRGEPQVLRVTRLTKGQMETFHVAPLLGRDIRADEFGPDGPRIVVLSYGFWQSRFGGSPDVLGQAVTLNGVAYEVVGVAPEGFAYPATAELWIPRRLDLETCGRGCSTMRTIGRLATGATVESLQAEVDVLALNLEAAYPETNTGKRFLVRSLQDQVVGGVERGLWLILGAVGIVLVIACANVANLLLVRASTRTGEVAVRSALGASRGRLITQVMVESGVIAVLGGLGGLALAWLGVQLLPQFSAGGIPRIDEIGIDAPVLLFTMGTVVLVTVLFGLAPAVALSRTSLRTGLGSSSTRGGEGRGSGRARDLLLGGEVALSAMLLVGAGLLLRSFTQLYAVDVGFETREVLRFKLNLPSTRYTDLGQITAFYRTLEERIRALPGVEAAGSVWGPPLGRGHASATVLVDGRPEPTPVEETEAGIHSMGPGWMETMRIPVILGRGLTEADDHNAQFVAVINETFVRENFPGEDPIGQSVRVPVNLGYGSPTWRIVGVVGDVRSRGLEMETEAQIYVPHGQYGPGDMAVTVRGTPGAPTLLPIIREEVRAMDASLPLYQVDTIEEALRRQVAPTRFYLVLVGLFAGLAAVLAAVGLYGVVAYAVSRRTREIGLRLALGAQRDSIVRLVVGQGMRPALVGLTVGLGATLAGGRVMEALLFGVQPRDPLILGGTAVLLAVVTLAAAALPAYRACKVDPVKALQAE